MNARLVFAKNMKKLRKLRSFSQEELAERAGFHRTYIGSVERSERNVSIDAIEKISEALERPIADFFLESNNKNE